MILFAIALLAQTTKPITLIAAEDGETADISQNTSETAPTVQEVLTAVCEDRGYGEACAKQLLGMLWKESQNKATVVGDHGLALGYFQIHYKLHRVSMACAVDLNCSANWTLDYLERNSYPKYVSYAIQCHNGCNIANGYAASALRHGNRLWNQPLAITTAAELAKN